MSGHAAAHVFSRLALDSWGRIKTHDLLCLYCGIATFIQGGGTLCLQSRKNWKHKTRGFVAQLGYVRNVMHLIYFQPQPLQHKGKVLCGVCVCVCEIHTQTPQHSPGVNSMGSWGVGRRHLSPLMCHLLRRRTQAHSRGAESQRARRGVWR